MQITTKIELLNPKKQEYAKPRGIPAQPSPAQQRNNSRFRISKTNPKAPRSALSLSLSATEDPTFYTLTALIKLIEGLV